MKTKAVRLYGKNDIRLEEFDLPPLKDDEILAQVVSDSICMSSYKAVQQGADHKRVPDDVHVNPTIIGHEFSGVLLEVGRKWAGQFKSGDKFSIQPAMNYKGRLDALPGVFDFIEKCRSLGFKMAVASSADEIKVMINLREIGLQPSLFDVIINGQQVERKKPFPDIFLRASDEIGLMPGQCLVAEDAVSGVRAAREAGCRCLALTTSFDREQLREADWVAKDLSEAPGECLNW